MTKMYPDYETWPFHDQWMNVSCYAIRTLGEEVWQVNNGLNINVENSNGEIVIDLLQNEMRGAIALRGCQY